MFPPRLSCKFLALIFTASSCLPNVWGAHSEPVLNSLELGKPVERSVSKHEAHSYTLNFSANQYAYLVVDQRGVDVVVAVYGPDAAKIVQVDSPNDKHERPGTTKFGSNTSRLMV